MTRYRFSALASVCFSITADTEEKARTIAADLLDRMEDGQEVPDFDTEITEPLDMAVYPGGSQDTRLELIDKEECRHCLDGSVVSDTCDECEERHCPDCEPCGE